MGHHAGRHALKMLGLVERILGIELLLAAQAVDLRGDVAIGRLTSELHAAIRERVTFMEEDRYLAPDIAAMHRFVAHELQVGDIAPGVA